MIDASGTSSCRDDVKALAKDLAPHAEESMNLDYTEVFFPRKKMVAVMQKALEKELEGRCAAAGGSCSEACKEGGVSAVQAASRQSFKTLAEKHGKDGWRHGAYWEPPESTLEGWREENPITPMHEDEAPVSTDKLASFH